MEIDEHKTSVEHTTHNGTASTQVNYECDYLVIGAGTCGMSFIDTLLTENFSATVILVDRNSKPGGHWTTAYPFVRLHQCSGNYGVNSEPLGKSLRKNGNEKMDPNDRASSEEIVEYYGRVLEKFQGCERFKAFFESEYQKEEYSIASSGAGKSSSDTVHSVVTKTGDVMFIRCKKIVMVCSKVIVPSMREAPFPVHESVNFINVNEVPDAVSTGKYTNYVVIGAGKTGSDTVIELLRGGVDKSCIKWIISQDIWYFIRENMFRGKDYYKVITKSYIDPLVKANSMKESFLAHEKNGMCARLVPGGEFPTIFKGATMSNEEMELLRTIQDVVRLGRISSIEAGGVMKFGNKEPREVVQLSSTCENTVFVDCMAENFFGFETLPADFKIFESNRINIGPFMVLFNPSLSSAIVAYLEAHIEDDDFKNKNFFLPKKQVPSSIEGYLNFFYCHVKSLSTLVESYPPIADLMLNSRLNTDGPKHYGFLKFFWWQLGPSQMRKKGRLLTEKIERGGFTDAKIDSETIEREKPEKIQLTSVDKRALSQKRKELKRLNMKSYP